MKVDIGADWRRYTKSLPRGFAGIGCIEGAHSSPGALAFAKSTNTYVQVNGGSQLPLDFYAVQLLVAKARTGRGGSGRGQGRRKEKGVGTLARKNVSLDDETIRYLTWLGKGNLSAGIRKAAALSKTK